MDVVLPTAYVEGDIIIGKYLFGQLNRMLREKKKKKDKFARMNVGNRKTREQHCKQIGRNRRTSSELNAEVIRKGLHRRLLIRHFQVNMERWIIRKGGGCPQK